MGTTWTVQNGGKFFGKEIVTFKSTEGVWAYGYGTKLSGVLAIETIVTGFKSEEGAVSAGYQHCQECAEESAADACAEDA